MFDTGGVSHTQKTKQITVWDVTGANTSPTCTQGFKIIVETVLSLNSPENGLTKMFSQVRFTLLKLQIPLSGG